MYGDVIACMVRTNLKLKSDAMLQCSRTLVNFLRSGYTEHQNHWSTVPVVKLANSVAYEESVFVH